MHAVPNKRRWTRDYLEITVQLRRGVLGIQSVKRGRYRRPRPILSYWGPFQLLLYSGRKLHESLRFNLPLTLPAGEPTRVNARLDRALGANVSVTGRVLAPDDSKLTHIVLVDRHGRRSAPWSLELAQPPKI